MIPEGVTNIGDRAFFGCDLLTSIVIPDSVTSIGKEAFCCCGPLEIIEYAGTKEQWTNVKKGRKWNWDKAEIVYLGKNTQKTPVQPVHIDNTDFKRKVSALTNFKIEDGVLVRYVGDESDVIIPEGITAIGDGAFRLCRSLRSVTIPDSVTSIGDKAFSECGMLTSIVIPEGVTAIGDEAFYFCSSLTSIVIPEGVANIGMSAFEHCESLTSIVIPEGVTAIGKDAFADCQSLTSIVIPEGVTSIGSHAFAGSDLLIIYCEVSSKPSGWSDSWNSINWGYRPVVWDCNNNEVAEDGNIYYILNGIRYTLRGREATVECQPNNLSGKVVLFKNIVYNGKTYKVTSIEEGAFYGCESLTSIVIPDSVISIGEEAFSDTNLIQEENGIYYVDKWVVGCDSSLNHVKLRNNTVGIAHNAFASCCSLTSITIPDSVKNINNAFDSFEDFENNVIQEENGVYYVDKWVVGCDSSLEYVKLRNNTVGIADGALCENDSITSIVMPDSVTSIGCSAFKNCSSLASIIIPAGVTSIGNHAFYKCSSLTSIAIPKRVTSIGDSVFEGCSKLESIAVEQGNPIYHSEGNCIIETKSKTLIAGCKNSIIPADGSVTSIGDGAFYYCSSLKSITIPDSITSIGHYAFFYCSSLTSITIPKSVTNIGDDGFEGCDSLKTIEYKGSEEQWEWVKKGEYWKPKDTQVICTGTYSGNSKSI